MNGRTQVAHTPGPWMQRKAGGRLNEGMLVGSGDVIVCHPYEPNPQDAVLIAAAPDLLEALKRASRAIRLWHGLGMGSTESQAWALYQASPEMKQINAAIAKAEGR